MKYLVISIFLTAVSFLTGDLFAATDADKRVEMGKQLAFDRKKGNCLACHMIADGALPGNAAPPLIAMKARFPDKEKLFEQVWDSRSRNKQSLMPPFGTHGILSKEEVSLIVDYIYTL